MFGSLSRRSAVLAVTATALLTVSFLTAGTATADEGDGSQPVEFAHNGVDTATAPVPGAVFGSSPGAKIGTPICSTATSAAANVNTSCEHNTPHNETSIAVNPTNPANIIGGVNDYQLAVNPGGSVSETLLSRAHVSFDGGRTWTEYPLNANSTYQASGDPAVAFDASGHAYYATLGFRFIGPTNLNPDVLVFNSGDGGRSWAQSRIATGSGNFGSVGDLLDKEYVAAWGNGNAIVTFGDFRLGHRGALLTGQIYSSVTHDYGATWSTPQVISGDLDQAFVSVPTVGANGRIFVAFMNTGDLDTGRDTYEVVEVSPTTGARTAGPFAVGLVIDGTDDYPHALGSTTYQDSTFRTWAAGNITADPTNPAHLAVVWSDMRNSQLPAPEDPYQAHTNSDVIVSQSSDFGRHWTPPAALARPGDQFMPWGAFDAAGTLRIGTFDRGTDPANHMYSYSLVTNGSFTPVSTAQSDPTRDDRWFSGTTLNDAFPHPSSFIGDYSNIAVVPGTTRVVAYWTDMREQACFPPRCGHGEDAYFASVG